MTSTRLLIALSLTVVGLLLMYAVVRGEANVSLQLWSIAGEVSCGTVSSD